MDWRTLAGKFREFCCSRYGHFERAWAVPLQYPPQKRNVPKEGNEGDWGQVNNSARMLALAFLYIAQYRQLQGNFRRRDHHARNVCFVEYPAGQYPVALVKCATKSVSNVIESVRQNVEDCCWCPDCIVAFVYASLQMYLLLKCPLWSVHHQWRVRGYSTRNLTTLSN
jgi:hypothetical protein